MSQDRWFRMVSKQRQNHLAKVASTPLSVLQNEHTSSTDSLSSSSTGSLLQGAHIARLSTLEITAEDSDIQSLPLAVIQGIWQKASDLLCNPELVLDAPSTSSSSHQCFVVASKSSQCPRIVQRGKSAQFSCEHSCPMWQSSRICSHFVAAAQFSGQLRSFVSWYKKSKSLPNLNRLAKVGMPKGSGRKGEKPPRKRKKFAAAPLTLVERDAVPTLTEQQTETPIRHRIPVKMCNGM